MNSIEKYVETVGPVPLPPHQAKSLLDQYLAGMTFQELVTMFPEYNSNAILYTAYHYNWPQMRDDYFIEVQTRMKQKVIVSKMQQLELVSGMIHAAYVEALPALQAYIKHPCEKNIPKTLKIKSLKDLEKAIEMMSIITGQDNTRNINVNGEITVDKEAAPKTNVDQLSDDLVEQLLKNVAENKVKVTG